jgi:hypothetical protein
MRTRIDALTTVSRALPAANANVDSPVIDLGSNPFPNNEDVDLLLTLPATTTLVDAKTVTFTVKDGAAANSLAAVTLIGSAVVTGKTGDGSDAAAFRFKLPSSIRRYIAVNAAVLADGGDNTATSFTVALAY